tara:strand:+ start:80 stop:475 length:396 start_codon:yes stop_codon:yes gene_type:complete
MRNIKLNGSGKTYSTSVTIKDRRMIDALLSKQKPVDLSVSQRKIILSLWGRNDISYKQRDILKSIYKKKMIKKSTPQTPQQRLILTTMLRVVTSESDAKIIKSLMIRRYLSEAQRDILNKLYNQHKDLMYV